jgi:hypothetical protein
MQQRLGEILVLNGACSEDLVHQALQHKAIFGGRIGTNLLELGAISEETLASVLGRQTGVPALCGDLPPDPRALQLLDRRLAARWDVVPYLLADRKLAVLARDPLDLTMLDEVAFATGKAVSAFVVPEARVWETLVRAYGIDREHRGLAPAGQPAPTPAAEAAAPAQPPADLIDEAEFQGIYGQLAGVTPVPGAVASVGAGRADELELLEPLDEAADGRAQPQVAVPPLTLEVMEALTAAPGHAPPPSLGFQRSTFLPGEGGRLVEPSPLSFAEAFRFLEGVQDRETIGRTVLRYARSRFERAVLLTIKASEARGWAGLGAGLTAEAVHRLRLRLGEPGVVDTVVRTRGPIIGPLARTPANIRLLKGLGGGVPRNAVLMPVLALGRVVNVLYADAGRGREVDPVDLGELVILASRIAQSYDHLLARAV